MAEVELLQYTPDPEMTIAAAAKLCYSDVGAMDLLDGLSEGDAEKFISLLMKMGHLSPIEHASFTFAVEGVSRALTHQLVRHRLASYSQQSQRYVTESEYDYITPPSVEGNAKALELYKGINLKIQEAYNDIRALIAEDFQKSLEAEGQSQAKAKAAAEKLANEDARFVLPNACETKIVVTMNARELLHFFEQRCCERAQWEIRELATQMLMLAREKAPNVFKNAGPPCINGKCPEGAMNCGKIEAVREKFARKA